MEDKSVLVGILKSSVATGYSIFPYHCKEKKNFNEVVERLTLLNLSVAEQFGEAGTGITDLAAKIEPAALMQRFSKGEVNPTAFFAKVDKKYFSDIIEPYFEKKLQGILSLMKQYKIPLYTDLEMPHLYPVNQIHFQEETVDIRLKFVKQQGYTSYFLKAIHNGQPIDLQHESNIILTHEPCALISENKLFDFAEDFNGKLLKPFLSKDELQIPERIEKKYFTTFLKQLVNRYEVEAEGFEIKKATIDPIAQLLLERDWRGQLSLTLQFNYGGKFILANNPNKSITEVESTEKGFNFKSLKRKMAWEKSRGQMLEKLGLKPFGASYRIVNKSGISNQYDLIYFLRNHLSHLRQEGFELDQRLTDNYVLNPINVRTGLTTRGYWFDLNIVIQVGDYSIKFYKFRQHILQENPVYTLPDGTVFLIPQEWFARYRNLFYFGRDHKEGIMLNKSQYRALRGIGLEAIEVLIAGEEQHDPLTLPDIQNVELRPYQVYGIGWMRRHAMNGFGCLLADDMGLGKTLQVIALLALFYEKDKQHALERTASVQAALNGNQMNLFDDSVQPIIPESPKSSSVSQTRLPVSLIVMPASIVFNWVNEIQRFVPWLRIYVHTGPGRKTSAIGFEHYQIVLTTYGTLRVDIELLETLDFGYVVLDESQAIKNPASKSAQSAFRLNALHRIALTGTPVENSLLDLWSQLNFLNPLMAGSQAEFHERFIKPSKTDERQRGLLEMVEPFILRRTREQVNAELPPLTEIVTYCTMTEAQQNWYESEKSKMRNHLMSAMGKGQPGSTAMMVLRALMRLRQLAIHPRMIDPGSEIESGKFEEVTSMLETILAGEGKVLLFSSFVKHLNLIEEWLIQQNIDYAMLTGSTVKREQEINKFRKNNKKRIFLISLKAGGVGLNLTEASYVFLLDPWWNPAAEMQAVARVHRMGQNEKVFVYRFVSKDSVEEKIIALQQRKLTLASGVIATDFTLSDMNTEEVLQLFS
ncbi:MAG: SNF2-related protein [Lentimicrobium sp.]|jgi:superfamily II DNA or RNA helicase|nr:SNF2-related protein [Lentimicrobium sp.]